MFIELKHKNEQGSLSTGINMNQVVRYEYFVQKANYFMLNIHFNNNNFTAMIVSDTELQRFLDEVKRDSVKIIHE